MLQVMGAMKKGIGRSPRQCGFLWMSGAKLTGFPSNSIPFQRANSEAPQDYRPSVVTNAAQLRIYPWNPSKLGPDKTQPMETRS
jgi:hypothetical protein